MLNSQASKIFAEFYANTRIKIAPSLAPQREQLIQEGKSILQKKCMMRITIEEYFNRLYQEVDCNKNTPPQEVMERIFPNAQIDANDTDSESIFSGIFHISHME